MEVIFGVDYVPRILRMPTLSASFFFLTLTHVFTLVGVLQKTLDY
jgi:hypothetical protein